tara:strand:+ start:4996 stop:5697 length:702 start_codon:yes stop_codon:yes gene_type:complete
MKVYAIIPARSGSKGLPDKNIRDLNGKPLMAYSIDFARSLSVDRVIVSTDSEQYAEIARKHGAEVPFLRSEFASSDVAMEEHILDDLIDSFDSFGIEVPDLVVWLRPTFVFRDIEKVQACIQQLKDDSTLTACRTVCESEARLYREEDGRLVPDFDDCGRSMVRRQEVGMRYKVFSCEVFRMPTSPVPADYLGRHVGYVEINKVCGLDVDDDLDFMFVEHMIQAGSAFVNKYL